MDKEIKIRIVRDDQAEFVIGNNQDWRPLVGGLDGFGNFSNELNYLDNATTDGGIISSSRIANIDRTIQCAYMYLNSNDVARKACLSFFKAKNVYKVYVTYAGQTRWAEGYLHKFSLPAQTDIGRRLNLTVTFMFANPYWKSFDDFGKDIAGVTPMTAFPYLCSADNGPKGVTGGTYDFTDTVVLSNDGDVDTYCNAVFKATGTVTNPKLIINDEYVRVIDVMQEGDVITMDFTANPPTVKKNGVNFIGHCDRTSSFDQMILGVGDTGVSFGADDGTSLLQVSIYYNKLYGAV